MAPPEGVVFERDVEVPMRDGVVLRVNVFRPEAPGRYPVIMSAHPYGKDALPEPKARGGYKVPKQFRLLPQSQPFAISAWTSWEAPDPAQWVPRGYVVVNCDLRGWGRSDGEGALLSMQEALDYHDLIEWAAAQPWSTGKVGLDGVSYLAISQWGAASTRPPHLAAICPWEGFTDVYRDFARPGGIREDGFMILWTTLLKRQKRSPVTLRKHQKQHPLMDGWWRTCMRDIEAIDVPALVCASFSDHNLHSRGSFEGFRRIRSTQKWCYTHRGPKWSVYYSPEATAFRAKFFDHFLRGDDTGIAETPPVRIEIREDASTVAAVRHADQWPPADVRWTSGYLDTERGTLAAEPPAEHGCTEFDLRKGNAAFTWRVTEDVDLVGPMVLRCWVEVRGAPDAHLHVAVRKLRRGKVVGFEGSYGYDFDVMTRGQLKVSHRALDDTKSLPWLPWHPHTAEQSVHGGAVVPVDIELLSQATRLRAGESLRLEIHGWPFVGRSPLFGQFPAGYEKGPKGTCIVHTGVSAPSSLLLPILPM
ncbi:MAG: CocE/NonD family hydrolase [Acidimicrobiia bacterium]